MEEADDGENIPPAHAESKEFHAGYSSQKILILLRAFTLSLSCALIGIIPTGGGGRGSFPHVTGSQLSH